MRSSIGNCLADWRYSWYIHALCGVVLGIIVAYRVAQPRLVASGLFQEMTLIKILAWHYVPGMVVFFGVAGICFWASSVPQWRSAAMSALIIVGATIVGYTQSLVSIAENQRNNWLPLERRRVEVEAQIVSAPSLAMQRQRLIVKAKVVSPSSAAGLGYANICVLAPSPEDGQNYIQGDVWRFSGKLWELAGGSTPESGFDFVAWYHERGIHQMLFAVNAEPLLDDSHWPNAWVRKCRWHLRRLFFQAMSDEAAALSLGMLLGDASFLDKELQTAFYDCGAGHLLAASGLNAAFVSSITAWIVCVCLFVPRRLAAPAIIASTYAYMMLAGCSPSIVRASIFVWLAVVANFLGRPYVSWRIMIITAMFLLTGEPEWLFKAGFWMSFAAVAGIIMWFPAIRSYIRTPWQGFNSLLAFSLAAMLMMIPLQLYFFEEYPWISLLGSIIITPVAELLFVFASVAAVALLGPKIIWYLPVLGCEGLSRWSIMWATILSHYCPLKIFLSLPIWAVFMYYATLITLRVIWHEPINAKITSLNLAYALSSANKLRK